MLSDYHIFQSPCAVKDAEIGIAFSELENEMGGGFYSQVLFGSENGERYWRLGMPSLTGSSMDSRTVTGINGETLNYQEYLWDLYSQQKSQGTPFAYKCPRSGNYYLVRFANKELNYSRMLTKLYSGQIELRQWRRQGETVYLPLAEDQVWSAWDAVTYPGPFGGVWSPDNPLALPKGYNFEFESGDVSSATVNGQPVIRFGGADGIINSSLSVTIKEAFLLVKFTEATFSADDGIITGSADPNNAFLNGESGTSNFYDLGLLGTTTYKLDGVEYPMSAAPAPMNVWGIVHVRNTLGVAITNLQIGADRDFPARHAKMDLRYLIIADELIPVSKQREIYEFLSILKAQLV
jgi:hypothetical protein